MIKGKLKYLLLFILLKGLCGVYAIDPLLPGQISSKENELQLLINQAKARGIDVTREETAMMMSSEFSKYATWDANNYTTNLTAFKQYWTTSTATAYAAGLADFERNEIIAMLNTAIQELTQVLNGTLIRRAVPKLDWQKLQAQDDQYVCDNYPVYFNDWFSKPATFNSTPMSTDYTGRMETQLLAISQLANNTTVGEWYPYLLNQKTSGNAGYVILWHSPAPGFAQTADPNIAIGQRLFTKYDIDNPYVRDLWKAEFAGMIPYIVQKPFLTRLGYMMSNEPHWYTRANHWSFVDGVTGEVSNYTHEKFKVWLKNKYSNDIQTLNANWGTGYTDFDNVSFTVPFPSSILGTPKAYDWQRFNMDRSTEWFKFMHDEIKKHDPDAKTHMKVMPHCFSDNERDHGLDFEAITELTEIIGNDAQIYKIRKGGDSDIAWTSNYAFQWREMMVYDFFKSVSPNKPNINSETHFISTNQYRDLYMTKEYTRTAYWLATLHGMNGGFSWWWTRDTNGAPNEQILTANNQTNKYASYVGSVCQQPRVAYEVAKTMMDLTAYGDIISTLQRQERPIRIFYSETTAINKTYYMHNFITPMYESLYFEGFSMGFATENIIRKQNNNLWKAIVVYSADYVTDSEFDALQLYLDNGGTIIIDNPTVSLKKNEYGQARTLSLNTNKGGNLIVAPTISEIKTKALEQLGSKAPILSVVNNADGLTRKGCVWKVIKNNAGDTIVSIVNIAKDPIILNIKKGDKIFTPVDLLTGRILEPTFTMQKETVLLLGLKSDNNTSVSNTLGSKIKIWAVDNLIHFKDALGKNVTISNILGQTVLKAKIMSDDEKIQIYNSQGIYIVTVENEKSVKVMIN